MAVLIRQATINDASEWVELLKATLGEEYPDKQVYTPAWALSQFGPGTDMETWIVEANGRLGASVSLLPPLASNMNPIANLGRHLVRPDCYINGSAGELVKKISDVAAQRKQHSVARILASDIAQQVLYEKLGYVCVGFQPFKHMNRVREGTLFYVRAARPDSVERIHISESLPQIRELATVALAGLKIRNAISVRDGTTGYPLQTELQCVDATFEDYERWRLNDAQANFPLEISGTFNFGLGFLRTASKMPFRAVLAKHDEKIVAGAVYYFDPFDRCMRIINAFAKDDLSMGAVFRRVLQIGQEELSAVYVEVDILVTAPRLLKTAEQLGFVPIAYLPEFRFHEGTCTDIVKLVKLNIVYSQDDAEFTPHARRIVEIIDRNFDEQKIGVAIIKLLRGLPIFDGLGDGELRKIARLFTQRLFRPGEKIFSKGDSGKEAYVVMRGAVDILLDEGSTPIASIRNGQIFGEVAFLDGAARGAMAVATEPTILLILQRSALNDLTHREPHLGLTVMRNVAMELSKRLRRTNAAVLAGSK
jgi:CRP/FNR family transcriptional regulator, cyclic AMP receptor protein